jgi:hypothetical protein
MKNMRLRLAEMRLYNTRAESERLQGGVIANGSGAVLASGSQYTRGTADGNTSEEARVGRARESSISTTDRKGLQAKGGTGWAVEEKSNGAGWEGGFSSNQTSLYIWMSKLRKGWAEGELS